MSYVSGQDRFEIAELNTKTTHAYRTAPNAYQIGHALAYYQLGYGCCGLAQNPLPLSYSSSLLYRCDARFFHAHNSLASCQMSAAAAP